MKLDELFKPVVKGEWTVDDDTAEFTFHVKDELGRQVYTIYMEKLSPHSSALSDYEFDLSGIKHLWWVEFGNDSVADRHGVLNVKKGGSVFGNVIGALKEAKEPSRKSLYDKMVNRLGNDPQIQDDNRGRNRAYIVS